MLGANDGIVSTAGLVFGVAGATSDRLALVIAGIAGMVAGALSMAGGEYVSVSTQRDTELAALAEERRAAAADPGLITRQLEEYYQGRGLSPALAHEVAVDLSASGGFEHHARTILGIAAAEQVSPWAASLASVVSFVCGALIPLLGIVLTPPDIRLPVTLVAVWIALLLTGFISARLGDASPVRPMLRNLIVGSLAMGLTYLVGSLAGPLLA